MSHGSDGGVAISVILNEMRIGAGGDPGRPHVHNEIEIKVLKEGSNKVRFQAFYLDEDVPRALRAIRRH